MLFSLAESALTARGPARALGVPNPPVLSGNDTDSPRSSSDFSGWVYLTSSEAKIEFKPVEPRNPWVDALGSELGRQVLVVLCVVCQHRSIIVCY